MAFGVGWTRISSPGAAFLIGCVLQMMICGTGAFSMVKRYDDESLSAKLKDIMDYEYAEEPLEPHLVKRQQNPGGTCTCTCETRPVNEAKPRQQQQASGVSLLRTAAVKPESAARIIDRPPSSDHSGYKLKSQGQENTDKDLHSKIIQVEPMDYSDMTMNTEPITQDEEQEKQEKQGEEIKVETPPPARIQPDQSGVVLDTWGHGSRFPWKLLPDTMCFRESCKSDRECCQRYNLCDKSAKVCVDCWYGSTCTSEHECCQRYPFCQRVWKTEKNSDVKYVAGGKCVNKL